MSSVLWLQHEFRVYTPRTKWNDVPGIYIFSGVNPQNRWYPLYVGQAESLAERLPNHERWLEALKLGATHVHARAVRLAAMRDALEKRLIYHYQPRLNTHHRGTFARPLKLRATRT